jgi:hypothetical protein
MKLHLFTSRWEIKKIKIDLKRKARKQEVLAAERAR